MADNRDSFIFYRSYAEALVTLPDKQRLRVYDALTAYALDGVEITLNGIEKGMFALIKPQIDANNQRYINGCKGGAPKGNNNAAKNNRKTTEKQPMVDELKQPKTTEKQPNENDIYESKKVSKKNNNARARAREHFESNGDIYPGDERYLSHQEIMTTFGVSERLRDVLTEFLRNSYLNKHIISNETLGEIIVTLDQKYKDDEQSKINSVKRAIRGGYINIKERL